MIKVMLVDDHDLVREGIRRMLDDVEDISVIAEAGSGETAIELARRRSPDVVLMDVSMPGIGGLEATRRITHSSPDIKVIAVTVYDDNPFPTCLIDAGASGYITKGSHIDEITNAIRVVHGGKQYFAKEIADKLAQTLVKYRGKTPIDTITDREMVVMLMVTQGIRNKEISERLCLSPKTTSTYRYRLFEKLGVNNDVALTRWAIRNGLVNESGSPNSGQS
ncbi:MAG: response regulator [Gammaproteobacteria bacterium]|nr:MAG: response regulator [Gammaproteobacteria bacterium]